MMNIDESGPWKVGLWSGTGCFHRSRSGMGMTIKAEDIESKCPMG